MTTQTATLKAYIPDWKLSTVTPEMLAGPEAFSCLTITTTDMSASGYILAGTAEATLTLASDHEIVKNAVEALRAKQAAIRAEAGDKCRMLDVQINNLLALENKA